MRRFHLGGVPYGRSRPRRDDDHQRNPPTCTVATSRSLSTTHHQPYATTERNWYPPSRHDSLDSLPLPTRNLLQLLTLTPGVTAPLTNNSAIGRNSPNVSVDGSRVTQNSYQINGIDANDISLHDFADVAVPAPETVSEVKIQTSLSDAHSQARAEMCRS